MRWFIVTFSFMTKLARHGSYFSHGSTQECMIKMSDLNRQI